MIEQMKQALQAAHKALEDNAVEAVHKEGTGVIDYECTICTQQASLVENIEHADSCEIARAERALDAAQDAAAEERVAEEADKLYSQLLPLNMKSELVKAICRPEIEDAWDNFEGAIIAWREADDARTQP